eukprot:CAMPEP_0113906304 /NCGR_PEP_ID=MMETSP0780_2-20120614/24646_1 /TAXON_ID=652834 /ORGANISM="Palpitomonas bilix" /LENGTH=65 /DNA_ID=CAMNT_0000900835 /DNA_START=85 /DNA_END=282 /DNA_ORIENTATION=+ /assembly_acc=CAM_ASM_000599
MGTAILGGLAVAVYAAFYLPSYSAEAQKRREMEARGELVIPAQPSRSVWRNMDDAIKQKNKGKDE